jgi:hypothetical protein
MSQESDDLLAFILLPETDCTQYRETMTLALIERSSDPDPSFSVLVVQIQHCHLLIVMTD